MHQCENCFGTHKPNEGPLLIQCPSCDIFCCDNCIAGVGFRCFGCEDLDLEPEEEEGCGYMG